MKTSSKSISPAGRFLFPVRPALMAASLAAAGLAEAAVPVRLTLNTGSDFAPAWDPRGETIVYMRAGATWGAGYVTYNLFQVQAGTPGDLDFATGPVDGFGLANNPAWIGSTGFLGVEERVYYHEYLKFDASKAPFTRTAYDGNDAAFTRMLEISGGGGGGRMVFSRDGLTALWRWSTMGGSGTQQIRFGPVSGLTGQAASSTGTRLIQTYHDMEQRMLSGMALSPDGSIAVISLPWDGPDGAKANGHDLWLYRLDGTAAQVNLTQEGSGGVTSAYPEFLPGGDRIVYARYSGGSWDLYAIKLASGERAQLTDTPKFSEYSPSVSGNGDRVSFTGVHIEGFENTEPALSAGETFNTNIYVMPLEDPFLVPEISVVQGSSLNDGGSNVNFGNASVGSARVEKTFTISNQGSGDLTGLAVSIMDSAGGEYFQITQPGATTLASGASATFSATFNPRVQGTWTAQIQIFSNDADESPFDITLSGTAILVTTPEIAVEQPKGSNLVDGKTKKSFGTVKVGKSGSAKTFTIRNKGTANLTGIAVTKKTGHAEDFVISAPAKTSLAPGTSTSFKVTFKPKKKGTHNASIHIKSNDADENPFDIQVTGLGVKR